MAYTAEPIGFQDQTSRLKRTQSSMLVCGGEVQQSGQDERHRLLDSLRGQHICIPNLHTLFQAWPGATSPHVAALRIEVDQTLNRCE